MVDPPRLHKNSVPMGRSDGPGTGGKAIQPGTERFESVASNSPVDFVSAPGEERATVFRSALLSRFPGEQPGLASHSLRDLISGIDLRLLRLLAEE